MINEVALGLLFGLLGWKIALIYLVFGLAIAIVAGWVIGRLHLEGWLQEWLRNVRAAAVDAPEKQLSVVDGSRLVATRVVDIVGKVWPWVLAGIAAGALIHGYVRRRCWPRSWPRYVVVGAGRGAGGVPLYSNGAGIIPVVEALLGKGAALGTTLAFMMSVIALSAPEMVILYKVLTARLLAVFAGVVALGILAVGFLFNALPI